jgi:ADP-ribose pyrophosphatase
VSEKTLSSQQIYDGRILKLRLDTVKLPSGRVTKREIVEHDDSIAIVAIDGDDNVLLVKQFRKAVEKEVLEIPAGGIEPGEEPVAAVKRELREETGFLPQRVERIGGFYTSPGYSSEFLHLFVASDLTPAKLQAEDTESIKVERVPISRILELIRTGAINDAKSVAGLLMLLILYLVKPVES